MSGLAWLAYLPVPGLALVPAFMGRYDRFTRYHAWQGGVHVGAHLLVFILVGLLGRASDAGGFQAFIGVLALGVLVAYLVGAIIGVLGALRGRYARVRPAWDLLAALGR